MNDSVKSYRSVEKPFFMESVQDGTNLKKLRYLKRGESFYLDSRQILVRSCHDALVACTNKSGERGILLVKRDAEPAKGYLWSLGGFFDRGVFTKESLASRIKAESGLDVDEKSFIVLGHLRALWKGTPNEEAEAKGLPLGIDDTTLLFFVEGSGNLSLDIAHRDPIIVTPKLYTQKFRAKLHPFIRAGMDIAISFLPH